MSVGVMNRVWSEPPCGGSQLLVLLALADNANDDNAYAWPSVGTLAKKTHMSERSVQRALRDLETGGLIRTVRAGGRRDDGSKRATVYEVLPEGDKLTPSGASKGDSGGDSRVTAVSPQPSEEPSDRCVSARERARLKISGKPVKPVMWERTTKALDEFNAQAGRNYGALTGAGQPSASAKRIYLRLTEWPELTDEQVADIIRRTLACKWWKGEAGVGVVFGPNVWEENMTRKPSEKQAKEAEREKRVADDLAAIQRIIDRRKA